MARWCYAVNGIAALVYLSLMGWGFAARQPGGSFLAFFALIALFPYALMAGIARNFASSRVITTTVFVVSLLGAVMTLSLDYATMQGVYNEAEGARNGVENCGPPLILGAAAALVVWFVLQMLTIGALFLAGLLWTYLTRRCHTDRDHDSPRPLQLDRWRGLAARGIAGGFTSRDQATADGPLVPSRSNE